MVAGQRSKKQGSVKLLPGTPTKPKSKQPTCKREKKAEKIINLALQGGGTHGAFTWGALQRLLEDDRIHIEAMTGTSAGAMNGAVMASGLILGGRKQAISDLAEFWQRVNEASSFVPYQQEWDKLFGNLTGHHIPTPASLATEWMTQHFSPYQYNIFDINPLRDIIEQMVDFNAIQRNKDIKLFVNATSVRSGKTKIFETHELTADMLMASACIPTFYKAVRIGKEDYWDGGYSGNPALYPLMYSCKSNDVVLIQINPVEVPKTPKTAAEIADRINEISFNSTLMREIRAILFVKKLLGKHSLKHNQYKNVFFHLIDDDKIMNSLAVSTKYNADWGLLTKLHKAGYNATDSWLKTNYRKLNKATSIDVEAIYL